MSQATDLNAFFGEATDAIAALDSLDEILAYNPNLASNHQDDSSTLDNREKKHKKEKKEKKEKKSHKDKKSDKTHKDSSHSRRSHKLPTLEPTTHTNTTSLDPQEQQPPPRRSRKLPTLEPSPVSISGDNAPPRDSSSSFLTPPASPTNRPVTTPSAAAGALEFASDAEYDTMASTSTLKATSRYRTPKKTPQTKPTTNEEVAPHQSTPSSFGVISAPKHSNTTSPAKRSVRSSAQKRKQDRESMRKAQWRSIRESQTTATVDQASEVNDLFSMLDEQCQSIQAHDMSDLLDFNKKPSTPNATTAAQPELINQIEQELGSRLLGRVDPQTNELVFEMSDDDSDNSSSSSDSDDKDDDDDDHVGKTTQKSDKSFPTKPQTASSSLTKHLGLTHLSLQEQEKLMSLLHAKRAAEQARQEQLNDNIDFDEEEHVVGQSDESDSDYAEESRSLNAMHGVFGTDQLSGDDGDEDDNDDDDDNSDDDEDDHKNHQLSSTKVVSTEAEDADSDDDTVNTTTKDSSTRRAASTAPQVQSLFDELEQEIAAGPKKPSVLDQINKSSTAKPHNKLALFEILQDDSTAADDKLLQASSLKAAAQFMNRNEDNDDDINEEEEEYFNNDNQDDNEDDSDGSQQGSDDDSMTSSSSEDELQKHIRLQRRMKSLEEMHLAESVALNRQLKSKFKDNYEADESDGDGGVRSDDNKDSDDSDNSDVEDTHFSLKELQEQAAFLADEDEAERDLKKHGGRHHERLQDEEEAFVKSIKAEEREFLRIQQAKEQAKRDRRRVFRHSFFDLFGQGGDMVEENTAANIRQLMIDTNNMDLTREEQLQLQGHQTQRGKPLRKAEFLMILAGIRRQKQDQERYAESFIQQQLAIERLGSITFSNKSSATSSTPGSSQLQQQQQQSSQQFSQIEQSTQTFDDASYDFQQSTQQMTQEFPSTIPATLPLTSIEPHEHDDDDDDDDDDAGADDNEKEDNTNTAGSEADVSDFSDLEQYDERDCPNQNEHPNAYRKFRRKLAERDAKRKEAQMLLDFLFDPTGAKHSSSAAGITSSLLDGQNGVLGGQQILRTQSILSHRSGLTRTKSSANSRNNSQPQTTATTTTAAGAVLLPIASTQQSSGVIPATIPIDATPTTTPTAAQISSKAPPRRAPSGTVQRQSSSTLGRQSSFGSSQPNFLSILGGTRGGTTAGSISRTSSIGGRPSRTITALGSSINPLDNSMSEFGASDPLNGSLAFSVDPNELIIPSTFDASTGFSLDAAAASAPAPAKTKSKKNFIASRDLFKRPLTNGEQKTDTKRNRSSGLFEE